MGALGIIFSTLKRERVKKDIRTRRHASHVSHRAGSYQAKRARPVKIEGRAAMLGSLGSPSQPPGEWRAIHYPDGSGSRPGGATGAAR
jgi:hypothetical protein